MTGSTIPHSERARQIAEDATTMTAIEDKARKAYTHDELVAAISLARNHALDEAAKVSRGYWVEADYDVVGVADADMAMKLCELSSDAILALKDTPASQVEG